MELIEAVLYGIVQGITEWLPISSTAHLRILPALLGRPDPGAGFTAVIQLGTILAVLIYFRKDLTDALGAWLNSFRGKGRDSVDARIGWGVFWGTIPIMILGFFGKDLIKSDAFRSINVIIATLIVMGIVMLIAERVGKQHRGASEIKVTDGIVVGLFQALALIPGMSRSGSTISGGLFAGLDRTTAARYSFLLAVPSITAAGIFELVTEREAIMGERLAPVLVASFTSFIVGYATIAFLLKFLQKRGIGWFVGYRFALAAVLLILVQTGTIKATDTPTESTVAVGTE